VKDHAELLAGRKLRLMMMLMLMLMLALLWRSDN
jgi:hypothetical protein